MATSNSAAVKTIDHGASCPDCGGPIEATTRESACLECGLVVDDAPIDHGPEWRSYAKRHPNMADDPRRASVPNRNYTDRGLGSEIGYGHSLDGAIRRQNVLHARAKTPEKKDRGRGYATTEIQRIGVALEIGDSLIKQAKKLFRDLHESRGAVGLDLDTLAATSVYTTTRVHQRGLTPGEVAEVARTGERAIMRRHKWLCDEMGIGCPPPDPRQRLRVVARECGLDRETVERALRRLDDLPDSVVYSGSPSTIAAAVLYDVLGGSWTQEDLGEAAGVSPVSIRNRMGELGPGSD